SPLPTMIDILVSGFLFSARGDVIGRLDERQSQSADASAVGFSRGFSRDCLKRSRLNLKSESSAFRRRVASRRLPAEPGIRRAFRLNAALVVGYPRFRILLGRKGADRRRIAVRDIDLDAERSVR